MVVAMNEVPETRAEGAVKSIYDELKATFRAPVVSLAFRILAVEPDYLEMAWRALKPNAQTVYFEQWADALRARAVEGLVSLDQAPSRSRAPDVVEVLKVFHYLYPKVFLAVAALRAATNGQHPKLTELSAADKRQVAPGVPEGAPEIRLPDAAQLEERTTRVLKDMTRTLGIPGASSEYAALAGWPDYLESAWRSWKPVLGLPEQRALERELRRMAEEAIAGLPFRMDIYPHALRHAGLSEHQIDRVRATLTDLHRLLPGVVASFAFFTAGAEGKSAALHSPFPATAL